MNIDELRFVRLVCGSVDGFSREIFHSKCDNIYRTLVIVVCDSGRVFGGFSDL